MLFGGEKDGNKRFKTVPTDDSPRAAIPSVPVDQEISRSLYERYWDGWYPEVTAIILSAACLTAIAIVLGHFDHQFAPDLAYGLTLNAIVSILSTASTALLMFAVSNAIGQLKWIWFNADVTKLLAAAEIHDNASRGPLGAIQVLRTRFALSPVAVGAIITLLALAIDPFVQQIIFVRPELLYTNSSTAVLTQARFFDPWIYSVVPRGEISISYSNYLAASSIWGFELDWQPDCPGGNCLWQDYQSLGWCSQCKRNQAWTMQGDCAVPAPSKISPESNATLCSAYTEKQSLVANIVPTDQDSQTQHLHVVSASFPVSNLTSPTHPGTEEGYISVGGAYQPDSVLLNPNTSLIMMSSVDWTVQPDLTIVAESVDCEIDICIQKGLLNVTNGQRHFDISGSEFATKSLQYNASGAPILCFAPSDRGSFNLTDLQALPDLRFGTKIHFGHGDDLTFCFEDFSPFSLAGAVSGLIGNRFAEGSLRAAGQNVPSPNEATWPPDFFRTPLWKNPYSSYLGQTPNYESWSARILGSDSIDNYAQILDRGIESLVANLTAAMTKMMHNPNINVNGTNNIAGLSGKPATLVTIRWGWFALPASLWLIGLLFLLTTIYSTSRTETPVWKSSTNALLYHGLDHKVNMHAQLNTVSSLDRQALQSSARLTTPGKKRRLLEMVSVEPPVGIHERKETGWNIAATNHSAYEPETPYSTLTSSHDEQFRSTDLSWQIRDRIV